MNVMNGFVTSSTLAAAVDVNDLHPVTDVPVASLLPIVTMACFIALLILIVAIVIMSRPRRAKRVAAPRGSHNALAPVSQWKSRVHDIVERNGRAAHEAEYENDHEEGANTAAAPTLAGGAPFAGDAPRAHAGRL